MTRGSWALGALLFFFVGFAGAACSSQPAAPPPPPPAPAGKQVDPATAASISGKVTFTGARPAVETLKMSTDQACVAASGPNPQNDAVLIADDGALRNVFVYVKDGLDAAYAFEVPASAVELDQKGCRYSPRVLGVQVGQSIEIMNNDNTLHNVHALPNVNQEFNQGMATVGSRMRKTFTAPEVMVRFKCDVHNWMASHVGVVAHPFFAVTSADGSFTLKGLPPGTYTIEAWHERLGTKTSSVTVGPSQTQAIAFTFDAPRP